MENEKRLNTSSLWKKPWLVLSALMNSISLITIGEDLKITFVKWGDFILISIDLIRDVSKTILFPFILLLSFLNIEIPILVRDIFLLTLIGTAVFGKAKHLVDFSYKTGMYNEKSKHFNKSKFQKRVLSLYAQLRLGFRNAFIVSIISWAGIYLFSDRFAIVVVIFLFLLLVLMALPPKGIKEKNRDISLTIRKYLAAIVVVLFFLLLANYFALTFLDS